MFEDNNQIVMDLGGPLAPEWAGRDQRLKKARAGTFTDNMSLPVHRWFRYSAGFSAEWTQSLINRHDLAPGHVVLDPFAGSGTTLIAANRIGVDAIGVENHIFVHRIACAKLTSATVRPDAVSVASKALLDRAERESPDILCEPDLLNKCYSEASLFQLIALREAWKACHVDGAPEWSLLWLAITSILRECSGVGTAQWQYVLPKKSKSKVKSPIDAFNAKLAQMIADIALTGGQKQGASLLNLDDARSMVSLSAYEGRVGLVVTSPPYPNNYDYADATRLEMTFWGEISSWGDLQNTVRKNLVRSCSQHSAAEKLQLDKLLQDPLLDPIRQELTSVCAELAAVRETKGGKKTYHTMVAAYFSDLARCWRSLYRLCDDGAYVYFVIGDSAPYGVHIPVEDWLGRLAIAAGFSSWSFEKIRDRNIKWKNRKHTVPLKEGHLVVRK